MNDFWNNIIRYPRFFISSLIGLILVILNPARNLFKIPKLRILLFLGLFVSIGFIYLIIANMTAL